MPTRNLAPPPRSRPTTRRTHKWSLRSGSVGFVAGFLMIMATGSAVSAGLLAIHGERTLPGVHVDSVDISSLSVDDATARLKETLPANEAWLRLEVDDEREATINLADVGWQYDYEAMLEHAMAVGREDGPLSELASLLRGYFAPVVVEANLQRYDQRLEEVAASLSQQLSLPAVNAQIMPEGDIYRVERRSEPGSLLATDRLVDVLRTRLDALVLDAVRLDTHLELDGEPVPPTFDTTAAADLARTANAASAELELTTDGESYILTRAQLRPAISIEADGDGYIAQLDESALRELVAQLTDELQREASDAKYARNDSGGIVVTAGVEARQLEVDKSLSALTDLLTSRLDDPDTTPATMALAVTLTPPAFSTKEATQALERMQVISSWTTYFVPGPGNFNGLNISIPAAAVDGHVVLPGETFDFWQAIGEVSEAAGYGPGGAIIDGRSVANGALAGGICSTSTTLFNTALRGGFEMGERLNHFYYIDRYPMGLDATVYQVDSNIQTMTFRNDTAYPLIIRSYNATGSVRFDIVSVPNGRTVAFSDPAISGRIAAGDTIEYTDELPDGTSQRVEWPHDGFQVTVERIVRDADGATIHHNTYSSNYRAVDGVVLVGRS